MVGFGRAAPVGSVGKTNGYVGTWLPVKVTVCTLMPLFEKAVPTMMAGVRPKKMPKPARTTVLGFGDQEKPRRGPKLLLSVLMKLVSMPAAASWASGLRTEG